MLRSLYSGISGMKNFQTKLDVIGNNIANVNTYGFKKGRVTFKDLVSQQLAQGTVGTNPKQVGLGSGVATIDTVDTQGSPQTTGRPLDVAIEGDGYFLVQSPGGNFLTRAGNFYLTPDGDERKLVTADGYAVLDVDGAEIKIPKEAKSYSIGSDGSVTIVTDTGTTSDQKLGLVTVPNPGGLEKTGSNLYRIGPNSGEHSSPALVPGSGGAGKLISASLEMSNVDLSEEFTEMIVAQRAFQSNTKIITTSDEILQELVNLKR
ncbi:flagellar basal body rod protein FlgG [Fictibacillus macauensis ZFHKF-1]|uniref:Flagellar basal body rod protein FlgG n=1 Tax=Fictibacillus macauensis ZFHKF-1 TaxID=1196324 RepID=I8UE61_9BACL|nr:flagellar basal body rod protein FlgG [Fictibacillus macauensis]EIT85088.1 flagellar basal body rod protein FlgG [Fictibacillus macauensis ZFHKF-1]